MIKKRLARFRREIKEKKLDGFLVSLAANRRYLSGFSPDDGQFGESSGSLLITQAAAVILTDFRYQLSARDQAPFFETVIYPHGLALELARLAPILGLKRLGFESEALLVLAHQRLAQELPGVELVPTEKLVVALRVEKDTSEVRDLMRALAAMETALEQILDEDLVGRTERELALAVTRLSEDAGADGPAFQPIVASGPNGAEAHAEPGSRVIQAGDPVIFDVGAKLDGYCSDISRTVVAGGREQADARFREVYRIVRQAQVAALEGIRPGMTGAQADAIARRIIEDAGYGPQFGHSLGHGVGLATHESPSVGPRSRDVLEPGMIFTVEPGIYLPGWGGVRLEQMVLLDHDGCHLLNQLDHFYDFS
ncbi:MAG: aminopeptidase P family protein [Deltaproteobacteria bacterium]|nr:aminopeptidase P family protein [Deltaproteobacteria bacterium]